MTKNTETGKERKYWRFRVDRWYGGIVTADVVGCGLLCKFCWVKDSIMMKPTGVGRFYHAEKVCEILTQMATKRRLRQLRVSGGEPTIGRQHLIEVLKHLNTHDISFVLETNGIMIGKDESYAKELAKFPFLSVRVALKGCCEEEFTRLTGANQGDFRLQLSALENLVQNDVQCHAAIMASFSSQERIQDVRKRIGRISSQLVQNIEIEELIMYPNVKKRISQSGLQYNRAFSPKGVPRELV